MRLTDAEIQSVLWTKIREDVSSQLELCRRQNDGDLDLSETQRLRGKIAAYKRILAYSEKDSPMEVENPDY